MAKAPRFDSPDEVGRRLRLIRLGYSRALKNSRDLSQAEMARRVGMGIQAWNNAETGDNRIGIDNALLVCEKTGATLEYIYRADARLMAHALAVEIEKLEAEPPVKKREQRA